MKDYLLGYSAAAVLIHAALAALHGLAHSAEHATLTLAASSFVAIVIAAAPFVALGCLWARMRWLGGLILFTSMLGALLFGLVFHYLLPGSDHVAQVPAGPWQLPFQLTAALLAFAEAAGAALGGLILYRLSRTP